MRFSPPRSVILGTVTALAAVVAPTAAIAAKAPRPLPAKTAGVRVASIERQSCVVRSLTGRGVGRLNVKSPVRGTIDVRTKGARGDWDMAIVDRRTGRVLTGSAQLGSKEYAATFVAKGQRLALQTCRRDGSSRLRVTYRFTALPKLKASSYKLKQVRISATSKADLKRLETLGLDLADSNGGVYWDALLHSARDEAKLKKAGFSYKVVFGDLKARDRRNRLAEERASRAAASGVRARASALSSGRTSYRTLGEINDEMKALAQANPGIVRTFELPGESWEGRKIMGMEVAENVGAADGRPSMVMVGTHHAREWPANEATLEWGYDLINGYKSGNPDFSEIVKGAHTYLVPVVNVDGFDVTTTSEGITPGGNYIDPLDSTSPFAVPPNSGNQSIGTGAYKRKNCRPDDGVTRPTAADCLARAYPNTLANADDGVDINRNYGVEWGGPGSATSQTDLTNHGPGPFSEPETEAVRRFTRDLQPSVLITNHTFSGLVLRPPGTSRFGPVPDEERLRTLGDAMADETQFRSQFSYQLYDTTGTTDDYLYDGLGAFSYTPEIGFAEFHPAYSEFTKDYEGRPQIDRFGDPTGVQLGGLRKAYTYAGRAVLGREPDNKTPAQIDSILTGTAPAGRTLRITKTATTTTSDRPDDNGVQYPVQTNVDPRNTTLKVASDGKFTWHVNPSRQPRDFDNQPGFWTLTCEDGSGNVLEQRNVSVERGQVLNLALSCGQNTSPTEPGGVGSCPLPTGFKSVDAKRRGKGLRLSFSRVSRNNVTIDVFQTSRGRTVFAKAKRVIRFSNRKRSFTWSGKGKGGKKLTNGVYYVRFRTLDANKRIDSRRLVVERKNGRFAKKVGFYLVDKCG